jgi:endonuclease YncB( thermonuclease family)
VKIVRVIKEVRAWDLGGIDWEAAQNERVRIKGGRALYDSCWASASRKSNLDVRLGRVEPRSEGPCSVVRWVDGDTMVEVVEVEP